MVQISSSYRLIFFDFAVLKLIYRTGHVKNDRNKKKLKHYSWGF